MTSHPYGYMATHNAQRRAILKFALAAGGVSLLPVCAGAAFTPAGALITRSIPSSGQRLPVVGLGSSATFSRIAGGEEAQRLRTVFESLVGAGGMVFDTAPGYGASEEVAGRLVQEAGLSNKLFWATKLNVARGGAQADVAKAKAQLQTSFDRVGRAVIDLVQVHNMGDVPTQLGLLNERRLAGQIRYIGVTTTFARQYADLEDTMRRERLDFIGVDYAIDNRHMEERILPLAIDHGIAVLAYAPFGRTRLWDKVKGQEVPAWAAELGMRSWAQFFLKFVVSHPAITCTTPATSRPINVLDNMGAAYGDLPDIALRERMAAHIAGL